MTRKPPHSLGFVPSLEVLPFFGSPPLQSLGLDPDRTLRPYSYNSYGNIVRDLLTGELAAGVLPLEIFISEIFALPNQQDRWCLPLLIHGCPTELVMSEAMFRHFHPQTKSSTPRIPKRWVIGVESRSSLTQAQLRVWLNAWPGGSKTQALFKMLPMDLMLQALKTSAVDGIIAPTPWGLHTAALGYGKFEASFLPGKFHQHVVLVHSRTSPPGRAPAENAAAALRTARLSFRQPEALATAAAGMASFTKSPITPELLEKSIRQHPAFYDTPAERVPDAGGLLVMLEHLAECGALPKGIAATQDTAQALAL